MFFYLGLRRTVIISEYFSVFNKTALFYLRSRGLPEVQARALLTGAFCREVVKAIGDGPTRALADAALGRALARLGA